ncbi:MAG: deoxyribonuclease V [Candidatus Competibacterales bacterium]
MNYDDPPKPQPSTLHRWDMSAAEAVALQRQLAQRLVLEDDLGTVHQVAGVDVGFEASGTVTRAAVAVLSVPDLQLVASAVVRQPTRFPYVPGLLSFRELPAVLEALGQLAALPDLILCDGQGIAHPRRLGIACHLGLWLDRPTIGVAKTRFVGHHGAVPEHRGGWTPLAVGGEVVGAVLRTRQNVKPLYVSPGHRISLATSRQWVMACTTRYRLPETTRWAHRLASGPPTVPTQLS